jgi:hypothetical protein
MNSIEPLPNSTVNPDPGGEFRRIPVAQLHFFPATLFDPETIPDPEHEPDLFVPLTVYQQDGAFIVIDGCKRLMRARRVGAAHCNCMVLTPVPDEHTASLLRITLNQSRSLNFSEKYLFIKWIKDHCDEDTCRTLSGKLLMDDRERFDFERLADMESDIVAAVRDGVLDIANATPCRSLEPAERAPVFVLLRRNSFSRQMQRELLDWLPELAFREKCSIGQLIAEPWITEIETNGKLNGPQKIDHLRNALFNRRFPMLAQAKAGWEELAVQLNPDRSKVQFKASEAFEKNRLEIRLVATSGEQAAELFSRLSQIPVEKWDRLIYPAMTGNRASG